MRKRHRAWHHLSNATVLLFVAIACGQPKDQGSGRPDSGATDAIQEAAIASDGAFSATDVTTGDSPTLSAVAAIVAPVCAMAGCHDPITKSHAMDVSTAVGIYTSWVGKIGLDHCGNRPRTRVVPGSPETSFVYAKITATESCGASDPMPPPPYAKLAPEEIETIRAWIAGGALSDVPISDASSASEIDAGIEAGP